MPLVYRSPGHFSDCCHRSAGCPRDLTMSVLREFLRKSQILKSRMLLQVFSQGFSDEEALVSREHGLCFAPQFGADRQVSRQQEGAVVAASFSCQCPDRVLQWDG